MGDDNTLDPPLLKILKDNLEEWSNTKLYKFYKSLTPRSDDDHNSYKCDSLKDCNDKDINNICNVCKILKKILDKWDTFEKYEGTTSDIPCEYLNYWIYGRLSNSKAHPNDIELFYKEWKSHYDSKKDGKNSCIHEPYNKLSGEELGNKKKVFDFSKYFSSLENILNEIVLNKENEKTNLSLSYEPEIFLKKYDNSSQHFIRHNTNEILSEKPENEKDLEALEAYNVYKEFNSRNLKNIKNEALEKHYEKCGYLYYWIYDQIWKRFGKKLEKNENIFVVDKLIDHYWDKCDNFFKCDKKYNLFDLLSEFNCIPEENREDINNAYENAVIDKKIKLLAEKIPEKSVTGTKQEVSELPKIVEQTNIFDELLNDPFNLSALGGYSLIGIFLTFFVFYKFTPLGSMMHGKSIKKNQLIEEFNEQYRESLQHRNPRPAPRSSQNKRVRIAYAAGNSRG
ncbi:Plasmodium vivax Vir protein, putative [Plasmodium vivax]|uniref:Vir protein, putative n=1 Tax=Plasmodium vivax TaxID=5855 RepID=A0A1G4H0M7_PLAVI|nr:Plasmodium vivax Vir protein, putative [Plasmodium vivax]